MNLVTLDFETYFDDNYTLRKMTTEAYVRDPRFKVHCVGYMWQGIDLHPFVLPGAGYPCIDDYEAYKVKPHCRTRPITLEEHTEGVALGIRDEPCGVLCHHAHFDGLILSHHYGIRPAFWFDTLSMARLVFPHEKFHSLGALAKLFGLQEKTVPYNEFKGVRDLPPDLYNRVADACANDVELTYALFQKMLPLVPPEELRAIDLTIRMFTEPALALDAPRMQAYLTAVSNQKEEILQSLGITKADLQSADKFADLLRSLGVEPPTKESPSDNGKRIYAFAKTDEAMRELPESDNPGVAALVGARLGSKSTIGETRAQRLLDMAARGPLPVYLKYYGAHTGRWAGGDSMNWQNFPRTSEHRLSIMAPPRQRLCVIDLAQIECRMLNWLGGQYDICEAFRSGRDLYSEGASRFYGREICKADKVERHLGKTLELGCGYGMGFSKFQATCGMGALGGPAIALSEADARRAVESYRKSHPQVVRLWKEGDLVLRVLHAGEQYRWGPMQVQDQKIYLPGGAWLDYSHLGLGNDGEYFVTSRAGQSKIYGAKLVENVVQALSRTVLTQAMLKLQDALRGVIKIVLTCHDEVVFLAPEERAEQCLAVGMHIMKTPPAWAPDLPLDAEGSHDVRYSK